MNKIGVIGGRDSVLGFRALGLTPPRESGQAGAAPPRRAAEEDASIYYHRTPRRGPLVRCLRHERRQWRML